MIFGYARVSTQDQNLDAQIDELKKVGAEKIFIDKISGKNIDREGLHNLLNIIRDGDTIVVYKLDRLARSLSDLINVLNIFSEKNIVLKLGHLVLDFQTPEGRLFANLFGSIAEYERELIRSRTMSGLEAARAQGRVGGKPKGLSKEALKKAEDAYTLRKKQLSVQQILKACDIKSKRTLYDYIRYYVNTQVEHLDPEQYKLIDNGLDYIKK